MSTEYEIVKGVSLYEASCKVWFLMGYDLPGMGLESEALDATTLRKAIIKQIEVLSYISDDPEEVMKRFNVNYRQEE